MTIPQGRAAPAQHSRRSKVTDDEELITRICIAYNSIYCEQPEGLKDQPEAIRRAILPIIKAERIRGGEMVKEAAIQKSYAWCPSHTGLNTVGDWLRKDLCALSVPAIVEAGDA